EGVIRTAPNLHPDWAGFPLARTLQERFRRRTRVLNDAGLQGLGVVEGRGVEMLLTFGTGMGRALSDDGGYMPNIELAHHPFRKKKTYEDYVGAPALAAVGKKRWNRRVARVVAQVLPIFNPRRLYLGGGNAKHLDIELPPQVHLVANIAGLLGGVALWKDQDGDCRCAWTLRPCSPRVAAVDVTAVERDPLELQIRERPVPAHVGIIMDGNGRWAEERGLPRLEGHR